MGKTDDWYFLSIAQYYGLATRLLDWTTDPLIALWFAFNEDRKYTKEQYRVVWGIVFEQNLGNYNEQDFYNFKGVDVFEAPKIDQRIINQKAWFSVQSVDYRTYNERKLDVLPDLSPPIVPINKIFSYDYFFVKMKIRDTKTNRINILAKLNEKSINHHYLFPDKISELCKDILHEIVPRKIIIP